MSLGELSKLIDTFQREGVTEAIMAGQVKHKQIFSSIRPDWKLAKLLLTLPLRNTDSLIGGVAEILAEEGITLLNSTSLLEPLLARAGVLTRRAADRPGADQHHLWTRGGASRGALRYRTDRGHRRGRLRRH